MVEDGSLERDHWDHRSGIIGIIGVITGIIEVTGITGIIGVGSRWLVSRSLGSLESLGL